MILKAITTSLLHFSAPLHRFPTFLPRHTRLIIKPIALFSSDKYHPLVEDLRKIEKEKDL
jgi:hypothetical protein